MGSDAHQGAFAKEGGRRDGEIYSVWGSSIKKRNLRKEGQFRKWWCFFIFFLLLCVRLCIGCGHVISRGVGLPVF